MPACDSDAIGEDAIHQVHGVLQAQEEVGVAEAVKVGRELAIGTGETEEEEG